jgi:hypothetical protein
MKRGRKPKYQPDLLEKGDKIKLKRNVLAFGHQYANAFNKRFPEKEFKFIEGHIERIV